MPTNEDTEKKSVKPESDGGEQKPTPEQKASEASDDKDTLVEKVRNATPEETAKHIRKLRNEVEANRHAAQELKRIKAEQEAALKQQQEAAERALAEQGQFKQLAEQRAAELERKDASIAELTAQVTALTEFREFAESLLEKRREAMPDALRKRVPEFGDPLRELQYIEANPDLFTVARKAADLNQGQGNAGGDAERASKKDAIRSGFRQMIGR